MVRADAGRRSGPTSTIGGAFHALLGGNAAVATVAPPPHAPAPRAPAGGSSNGGRRAATSAEGDGDHFRVKPVRCRGVSARVVLQNANGPCPLLALVNVLALRGHLSLPSGASFAAGADLVTALRDWLLATTTGRAEADPAVAAAVTDAAGRLPALRKGVDVNIRFGAVGAVEFSAEVGLFDLFGVRLLHGWVVDPGDTEVAALVAPLSYNGLVELLCAPEEEEEEEETEEEERAVGVGVDMAPGVVTGAEGVDKGAIAPTALFAAGAASMDGEQERGVALTTVAAAAATDQPVGQEEATVPAATAPVTAAATPVEARGDVAASSLADTVTVERDGADDCCGTDTTAVGRLANDARKAKGSAPVDEAAVHATVDGNGAAVAHSSEHVITATTLAPSVPVTTTAPSTPPAPFAIADTAVDTAELDLPSAATPPRPPIVPLPTAPAAPRRSRQALARAFLSASPSQLTPYGLAALHGALADGELAVLFRNNHLSTITRHGGELYLLVSDVGYLHKKGIVWERLDSVSGDSAFFSGDFVAFREGAGQLDVRAPTDAAGEAAELAAAVAASQADAPLAADDFSGPDAATAVADDDGDDDAALARALQAEEDALRAAAATSDADARLARRLHDEERAAAAAAAAAAATPPSARLAGGARRGGGRGGGGGGRGRGGRPAGQPPRHRAVGGAGRPPSAAGRGGSGSQVRQPATAAPSASRTSSALDSSSCVVQ